MRTLCGFFVVLILFASCNRDNNHPGFAYLPDMYYSPAFKSYEPNPNFNDSTTMQLNVIGAISLSRSQYLYEKGDSARILAGLELYNPLENKPLNIENGKLLFKSLCVNCHGEKGDGRGNFITDRKYFYSPAKLNTNEIHETPIGEIYHVIVKGHGIMGPQGGHILTNERWQIAMYISTQLSTQTHIH